MAAIQLLVGLANPGDKYANTRHNAGAWLVQAFADQEHIELKAETKFNGQVGRFDFNDNTCWLLIPTTYMNHSGQAVAALAKYYKVAPEAILIAHDELDFDAGKVKFKQGGGHGGHNGLRDIIGRVSSREFHRLRLGIGHPGNRDDVTDYVLKAPSKSDRQKIDLAIDEALRVLPSYLAGEHESAMQELHTNV